MKAGRKKMIGGVFCGILFAVAWMSMFWIVSIDHECKDEEEKKKSMIPVIWWFPIIISTIGWFMTLFIFFDENNTDFFGHRSSTYDNRCVSCYIGTIAILLFSPFLLSVILAIKNPGMNYAAIIVLQSTLIAFSSISYAFVSTIRMGPETDLFIT